MKTEITSKKPLKTGKTLKGKVSYKDVKSKVSEGIKVAI